MSKLYKLLGCFFVSLSMFFLNTVVPVNAYSDVPLPYGGTFKEGSLKYWIAYSFGISDVAVGSSYVREPVYSYRIIMSDAPIFVSGDKIISPQGTKYINTSDLYRLNKSEYYGQSSYNIQNGSLSTVQYSFPQIPPSFNANHTVKNKDGSDFFRVPFLKDVFKPVVELVQKGTMITLGSMIFLVGLGISLVRLRKSFKKFSRS